MIAVGIVLLCANVLVTHFVAVVGSLCYWRGSGVLVQSFDITVLQLFFELIKDNQHFGFCLPRIIYCVDSESA